MECPKCKTETTIISTRKVFANGIRRRRECKGCGHKFTSYEFEEDLISDFIEENKYVSNYGGNSLCWKCGRATGFCPWSREFEPVQGWTANKTIVRQSADVEFESYEVIKCPLFEPDGRH